MAEKASCGAEEIVMEKIMWLVLGGTALVAALRASSRRAMYVGRWALGILFIGFGAIVNAIYLAEDPGYYAGFADASPIPFVTSTWDSLVAPNASVFIGLLIFAEAVAGVLILSGGMRTQIGLVALIVFHIGQLAFGGALWVWAPVMLLTLVLLLRAERQAATTRDGTASSVELRLPAGRG